MKLEFLIVDDSDIVIFLHTEILSYTNLTKSPFSALNGESALEILQNLKETQSEYLVLLDINMPVMDGWQFLEEIQKDNTLPPIFVVMVTSSIDSIDKLKAAQFPQVIGFFEKPLSEENCYQIKALNQIQKYFVSTNK